MATYHRTELTMLFGGPGVGKTQGAMSMVVANPTMTFHYLEADRILDPVFEMFEGAAWDNLIRYPAFTYEDMLASQRTILEWITNDPQPWNHCVIIDTVGHCYREMQNVYSLRVHHMTAEALKATRMNANNSNWKNEYSFDGFSGREWPFIRNAYYNEFLYPLVRFHGNNAVLIAHSRAAGERFSPQAPTEYRDRYAKLGQSPDVHKDTANHLHTVLYLANTDGPFTFCTLKDTGRRRWIDLDKPEPFDNWWEYYAGNVIQ